MLSVNDAAEFMLENGGYFTAKNLLSTLMSVPVELQVGLGLSRVMLSIIQQIGGSRLSCLELTLVQFVFLSCRRGL